MALLPGTAVGFWHKSTDWNEEESKDIERKESYLNKTLENNAENWEANVGKNKKPLPGFSYPNLDFALLCLRNSVFLLHYYDTKIDGLNSSGKKPAWSDVKDSNYCNPSPTIKKESYEKLRIQIYTAYSFVCLRLSEYKTALEYGQLLLNLSNLSVEYSTLACLYCTESLVMLDRTTEARSYVELGYKTILNSPAFEITNWKIPSITAAKSLFDYNFLVILALNREYNVIFGILKNNTCGEKHPIVAEKFELFKKYIEGIAD